MTSIIARRTIHLFLSIVAVLLLELPASSCGPDWPTAIFVKRFGPDAPYAAFAAGRIGIPQATYKPRHLVVLYDYLSGRPLTPEEQKEASSVDVLYNSSWEDDQKNFADLHPGYEAWLRARQQFGLVDQYVPKGVEQDQYYAMNDVFENCLEDGFATAATTLKARLAAYGSHSPEVAEWVRGQDAVFSDCDKGSRYPAVLSDSAPLWLRQDRAYQMSASKFYLHQNYDAITGFRAIAADTQSSWSPLARYLVGRILVTEAVSFEGYFPPFGNNTSNQPTPEQRRSRYLEKLQAARNELVAMRSEPRMKLYAHAIDALLDRVAARLDPAVQSRTLAKRLTSASPDTNFRQDLIDLSLLRSDSSFIEDDALRPQPRSVPYQDHDANQADDLLAFLEAFKNRDEVASLDHWRRQHTMPWLIAALTFAQSNDPSAFELVEAARGVSRTDPGWTAAQYHRLRLGETNTPASRANADVSMIVADLRATQSSRSTLNLFLTLQAHTAPDFPSWLALAARLPAAQEIFDEDEVFDPKITPRPCSKPLSDADTRLFDRDAATVLNTRIPLRMLIQAAQTNTLAPHLRFTVAQSAWARAVLLDRPADARKLTPLLESCSSLWRPVLEDYDHAHTATDRDAAALFALMRFASTETNVRVGNLRVEGFAHYSYYRDNWWSYTVPDKVMGKMPVVNNASTVAAIPEPAFLSFQDQEEAASEYARLNEIPDAPTYFYERTTAWQHDHPHDPRSPNLLGEAFRVIRNGDGTPANDNLASGRRPDDMEHKLFLLLHQQYPNSSWTKHYKSWVKDAY